MLKLNLKTHYNYIIWPHKETYVGRNHIFISIDDKKSSGNIQHAFMMKFLETLWLDGMCLKIIKAIYNKPLANIKFKLRETENILSKIRNGTRVSFLALLLNIILEVLARAIRQDNDIKRTKIGKEKVKLSLFADDMSLYLKDSINGTRNSWTQQTQ